MLGAGTSFEAKSTETLRSFFDRICDFRDMINEQANMICKSKVIVRGRKLPMVSYQHVRNRKLRLWDGTDVDTEDWACELLNACMDNPQQRDGFPELASIVVPPSKKEEFKSFEMTEEQKLNRPISEIPELQTGGKVFLMLSLRGDIGHFGDHSQEAPGSVFLKALGTYDLKKRFPWLYHAHFTAGTFFQRF